jgi:hypothetical protein
MPITKTLLCVPLQYTRRTNIASPVESQWCVFDQDPDTTYSGIATTNNLSMQFDEYMYADGVVIKNLGPLGSWGTDNYFCVRKDAGELLAPTDIYTDVGTLVSAGAGKYSRSDNGTALMNIVALLGEDADVYKYTFDFTNPSGLNFSLDNVAFCSVYSVPLYNQDYTVECSFLSKPYGNITLAGTYVIDYASARQNRLQEKWNVNWKTGDESDYVAFKNFLKSFGNCWQPFYMAVIDDAGLLVSNKSAWFIMNGDTVSITYDYTLAEWTIAMELLKIEKYS